MRSAAIEVEKIEVVGVSGQRVAWNIFAVCGMEHGPTTAIAYQPFSCQGATNPHMYPPCSGAGGTRAREF
jgi:hypothetical protein